MKETRHDQKKGRGAQVNPHNRFFRHAYANPDDAVMPWTEHEPDPRTTHIEIFPKQILNENNSPDLGFRYGINPYNGCEHGCVYCYARNTHEYWGYSAGTDFETKILVKKNAPALLKKTFTSKSYEPDHIMFSGNTDCYQPAERQYGITRKLLEIFLEHKHPVGIITKNHLILRDLDILRKLNDQNLLRVTLSITTLREDIRRAMEPRTSSVANRLRAVDELVQNGIPVNVNMAPIIPGLNSDEIFELVKTVGELGAYSVSYIMVRLNGQIAGIFEDWVHRAFPERAEKILHHIRETHGGTLNESRWGVRMRGQGKYAEHIKQVFDVARKKHITASPPPAVSFDSFIRSSHEQLKLF